MTALVLAADGVTDSESLLLALSLVVLIGPVLATRLHLPGLLGLVVGGAIIGPSALGLLADGQIDGLGDIGLLYLMFSAGLELDLDTFARYRRAAISFGIVTFTLPFLLGWGSGMLVGQSVAGALLLGSIWASHTLVAYPEVRRAGLASNRAVTTVVGATVLTDVLSLVVLALISGSQQGGEPATMVAKIVAGLAAIGVWCFVVIPRVGRWFFAGPGQERTSRFMFLLAAMTSAALIGEQFGIEGLVGAFLAGIGANRLAPNGGRLMDRVEFFGTALFIPAFLIYVGTKIDVAVLGDLGTWKLAGLFLAVVVVGKTAAGLISGRQLRFERAEIGLLCSMTYAQAAATLAATLVGASLGFYGDDIVNAVVVVVMVTIMFSTIGTARFAPKVTLPEAVARPLGQNIVLALPAGTDPAPVLRVVGPMVAAEGGRITTLVVETDPMAVDDARARLDGIEQRALETGVEVDPVLRLDGSLADGVLRTQAEQEGSLVIVPMSPRLVPSGLLFGSAIDRIGAGSPVAVAAGRFVDTPITRVVLVLDGDPSDQGQQVDLSVVCTIGGLVARPTGVPVEVLASERLDLDALQLPDGAAVTTVARRDFPSMAAHLHAGDLVVLPTVVARRGLTTLADRLPTQVEGLSVLVAAGPYRLSLSGREVRTTASFVGASEP